MPDVDINKAEISNYSGQTEFAIDTKLTDGISAQKETEWTNLDWSTYWGYFNNVGDLKSALLMKAVWAVGKGWDADPKTTIILNKIKGWGKDTFDDILFNQVLISYVNGDSYAEIIRNEQGTLINLKPLSPESMVTVIGSDGIIIKYKQISKVKGKKEKIFQVNDILHLVNNRLADQIHGISDIEALKQTILADQELFEDLKKVAHFQAKPFILWKLKTDDPPKIAKFITRVEQARKLGEDLFVPDDEDIATWEVVQITPNSFLLDWGNFVKNKYFRVIGMPEVLFGTSGATESGGKMEVFSHETVFAHNQRFIERQLWNQLAIKIKLKEPTSLLENLQTDQAKDANVQTQATQANEVTP